MKRFQSLGAEFEMYCFLNLVWEIIKKAMFKTVMNLF